MNIKNFNSASRKAAIAAVAIGLVGFGASATAFANTTPKTATGTTPQLTSAARTTKAHTAAAQGCERVTFTVMHNDRTGGIALPQGPYVIWSSNMTCQAASEDFTDFLNHYQGAIPGWTGHQEAPGYGSFTNAATGESFSVGHMADQ